MTRTLEQPKTEDDALEHFRDVWELTHDPDRNFPEKLQLLFSTETETLDFAYGFLTQTEPATDTQFIEAAHGSHELLQAGETTPLSESYCRHTLKSADGRFHVADAQAEGFENDPAYDRFGLESYVGSVVEFGGQTYGTLCFAASEPLETPLSKTELEFIDLLSTWASRELRVESTLERHRQQSEQIEELATLVSHDLRNPLQAAQGHLEHIQATVDESVEYIDTAHERMNEIIGDLLTLAKIDEPIDDPLPTDIESCARTAWELVETADATLETDLDGTVIGDEERIRRLLENLFRNAIEHGGSDVTVEVGGTARGFYVADDGTGIPESQQEAVLEPGFTTGTDNTGLGLLIVRRIATAHGWEVSIGETETGGAKISFSGVDGTLRELSG